MKKCSNKKPEGSGNSTAHSQPPQRHNKAKPWAQRRLEIDLAEVTARPDAATVDRAEASLWLGVDPHTTKRRERAWGLTPLMLSRRAVRYLAGDVRRVLANAGGMTKTNNAKGNL